MSRSKPNPRQRRRMKEAKARALLLPKDDAPKLPTSDARFKAVFEKQGVTSVRGPRISSTSKAGKIIDGKVKIQDYHQGRKRHASDDYLLIPGLPEIPMIGHDRDRLKASTQSQSISKQQREKRWDIKDS